MTNLNNINSPISREERNKLNENFQKLERKNSNLQGQVNQLVVEGDSSPEAAQARVGVDGTEYTTLKQRIDSEYQTLKTEIDTDLTQIDSELQNVATQLAQKATKEELKNIGDASPKGTYPTLADLEADFPQGSTGIYIVTSNGNWYYWNSEAWTPGGLYQSMGIDDKSISEDKVTFIESGKNLFNPDKALAGYILNSVGQTTLLQGYTATGFIPVRAGVTYTISNPRNYALYNSEKVMYEWISDEVNKNSPKTLTPTQDGFLRTSFMSTYLSSFQIEIGNKTTEYEPPSVVFPKLKFTQSQIIDIANDILDDSKLYIYKFGSVIKIRSKFDEAKDIVLSGSVYDKSNKLFNFDGTYLYNRAATKEDVLVSNGENIHPTTDDIAPIRTFYTVGANHGYFMLEITQAGKTVADIGSVWTDGINQWIIVNVVGSKIYLLPDYKEVEGIVTPVTQVTPTTNLSHVNGATNTTDISVTTKSSQQAYPSIKNINRKFTVNGKEVGDVERYADVFQIHESYDILDYKSLIDKIKTNKGVFYETFINQIDSVVKMSVIYEFKKGGKCVVYHSFLPYKKIPVQNIQLLQSNPLSLSGQTTFQYMPNVLPKGGYDFKNLVNMTSYSTNLIFGLSDYIDPNIPPHRYVQWLQNGFEKKAGFTMGYIPDKLDGASNKRKIKTPNAWDLRSTKKNYPLMMNPTTLEAGERYSIIGYRNYLPPIDMTNFNEVEVGNEVYVFVDYHKNVSFESLPLSGHSGKNVEVVEKSPSTSVHSEIVDADGVLISVTGGYGYAILKLT